MEHLTFKKNKEKEFENAVCKMAAILSRSQCVKGHLFYSNSERAVIEYRHHVFYKRPPDILEGRYGQFEILWYISHGQYTFITACILRNESGSLTWISHLIFLKEYRIHFGNSCLHICCQKVVHGWSIISAVFCGFNCQSCFNVSRRS